jgi:molybdenum cofactor cytidylyltransferase
LITGIILAGGMSKRLGRNKMDVLIQNKKVLQHTVDNMIGNVDFVTLVTGHYKIKDMQPNDKMNIVENKNYKMGMFTSIKRGIEEVQGDVFIIPGDYPMVKEATYKKILESTGSIRVPTYNGRKGHPIYISKDLIQELKSEPLSSNLKVWRDKHTVTYIEVDDPGILRDLDTEDDYEILKQEMRVE